MDQTQTMVSSLPRCAKYTPPPAWEPALRTAECWLLARCHCCLPSPGLDFFFGGYIAWFPPVITVRHRVRPPGRLETLRKSRQDPAISGELLAENQEYIDANRLVPKVMDSDEDCQNASGNTKKEDSAGNFLINRFVSSSNKEHCGTERQF